MYWSDKLMLLSSIPFAIFPYMTIFMAVCRHFELESDFLKDEGFIDEAYFRMHDSNSFWAVIVGSILFVLSLIMIYIVLKY